VKLDKVATLSKSLVVGEIGEAGTKLKKEINLKISEVYLLSPTSRWLATKQDKSSLSQPFQDAT
jgi:hypothetical protein